MKNNKLYVDNLNTTKNWKRFLVILYQLKGHWRYRKLNNDSSKQKIIKYLREKTNNFDEKSIEKFTTSYISEKLHLSRSLVSLYLNNLYEQNELIKITTRPVYYFDKKILEYKFEKKFVFEYLSLNSFLKEVETSFENDPYKKIIGHSGTLSVTIDQLKAAMLYPSGLPVLLVGDNGTGKKVLAELSTDFCKKRIFLNEDTSFIIFNQANISELNKLNNNFKGVVYIENIHELNQQQEIFLHEYIQEQNNNKYIRIVFSTLPEEKENISANIAIQIPIVITVPTWEERYKSEKLKIIYDFFKKEELLFNKRVKISEKVIKHLVETSFQNNIDDIKRRITSISASAYSENLNKNEITIYPYHDIYNMVQDSSLDLNNEIVFSLEDIYLKTNGKILNIWENIIENLLHDISNEKEQKNERYYDAYLNEYTDFLIFEETYTDEQLKKIEQGIQNLLHSFANQYYLNYPINFAYILARMLLIQNQYHSFFKEWEELNTEKIEAIKNHYSNIHTKATDYTNNLIKKLKLNFKTEWFFINKLFIYFSLIEHNNSIRELKTKAVILCHGYSTASSIADTVNKMLKLKIFEAIDVPIDQSIDKVSQKLNDFLIQNDNYENHLFLVDMGSLEHIAKDLKTTATVGIINHVSTPMALNIGDQISKGLSPKKILSEYDKNNIIKFYFNETRKKDKAIIFSSDMNPEIAQKLGNLLKESLPHGIPLKIVSYSETVQKEDYNFKQFLEQYEVVLLVRPTTLKLDYVPNVAIEDIINFTENDWIFNIFKRYLNDEEMKEFRETLLINFSMDSLMNKLLILNPHQLLKQVSHSIKNLQFLLKKQLSNRTIIGLNAHICFLIEKLVTKGQATSYPNVDNFEKENEEFIDYIEESFLNLIKTYNVELPISEIAYIYEYITND